MTTSSDQYFKRHKRQSRPSKQYKSRIDVLILRQYLKKDFFVEKKKNGEGQGGKYLQKENYFFVEEKKNEGGKYLERENIFL